MTITINDDETVEVQPGEIWTGLERYLVTTRVNYNDSLELTRISRDDKGSNYSSPGAYTVDYVHSTMGLYTLRVVVSDS